MTKSVSSRTSPWLPLRCTPRSRRRRALHLLNRAVAIRRPPRRVRAVVSTVSLQGRGWAADTPSPPPPPTGDSTAAPWTRRTIQCTPSPSHSGIQTFASSRDVSIEMAGLGGMAERPLGAHQPRQDRVGGRTSCQYYSSLSTRHCRQCGSGS